MKAPPCTSSHARPRHSLWSILPCQAPSLPLVHPPMPGPVTPSGPSSHARPRHSLWSILPCQAPSLPLVHPPMPGPVTPSGPSSHARPRHSRWSILPCQAPSLPLVHPTPCRHTLGMWGTACAPLHQSGCPLHFLMKEHYSRSIPAPGQSLTSNLANESSSFLDAHTLMLV